MLFASGDDRVANGPEYAADGQLKFPANYREWVFLTSALSHTVPLKLRSSDLI